MLRIARPAAASLLLFGAVAAHADAMAAPAYSASAAVVHRRLVERADNGMRLVTESGELLRLQGDAQLPLARGGALRGSAVVAAGTLDYDGRTQAGVPLASDSAHRDLELGLAWRPVAPGRWGEGWLALDVLQQRRRIASTPAAQGVRETTTLVLPGLRWSHAFDAAGWRWSPGVALRASARQRIAVDFGGLFDEAHLHGGRRREIVLRVDVTRTGSPWRWGLAWSHARQAASDFQPLFRGGVLAGSVREPRVEIDDVMLRVTREF